MPNAEKPLNEYCRLMFKKGYTTINFFIAEKIFITQGIWGIRKYFWLKQHVAA